MAIVGLIFAFSLNCIILTDYYICKFITSWEDSLTSSSNFFDNMIPSCMIKAINEIFSSNLEENFANRHKPFHEYVGLSQEMNQLVSYPFDRESQLLQKLQNKGEDVSYFMRSSQN